ncbi:MAG: glycosyltransferase [Desulfocucumaceae bacterium]
MPHVSIIVPTHKRPEMLGLAVQSVLSQSYKDFELIVVDDGSKDSTPEVMEKYSGKLKFFSKENGGVSSARNFGLKKASGQLIAWLDDDDYFLPDKLEKQVDYLSKNSRVGLVCTGHVMIDSISPQVKKTYYIPPAHRDCTSNRRALLEQCYFANSTVMMKRECFDRAGLYDEGLRSAEDYDMWLRVAAHYLFGVVPEVLTAYRWHGRQISMTSDTRALPELKKKAARLYEKYPCREVK